MGDRPGSLKLGSFKLLDVGGREQGCSGRGCILSDAALCSNVDCSQILLLQTPGRTAHDTEVGSPKHFLAHLFDLGAEGHTTIVCYAQECRRRGAARWDPIDGNLGSPLYLSVIQTEESYFAFCSNESQARLLAPAYYLVDFGLHSQGDAFFLTPRQARARSSA